LLQGGFIIKNWSLKSSDIPFIPFIPFIAPEFYEQIVKEFSESQMDAFHC